MNTPQPPFDTGNSWRNTPGPHDPFPYGEPAPAPPPAKKGMGRTAIALATCLSAGLFLIAMATLVSVVDGPTTKPGDTAQTSAVVIATTEAPAPASGSTAAAPAPIGQEITPAKGWYLTVTGPAVDITDTVRQPPMVRGNRLLAVPASVRNDSGRPAAALGAIKIGLLPPSGVRVDPMWFLAGSPILDQTAQLQPGAHIAGNLVFEVSPADVDRVVLLAEPEFTLDENDDQRFLSVR